MLLIGLRGVPTLLYTLKAKNCTYKIVNSYLLIRMTNNLIFLNF